MSDRTTTFHYAEEYVQRGYAVIPLVGKIPPSGFRWSRFQRRRATLAEISSWFGTRSACHYNIGIVTGTISGLVVVDIDSVEGVDWWTRKFPTTPLGAVTGRGGLHLYYRANPAVQVRNRAGVQGRKIDIRGEGGYVVAPPSIHVDTGKVYQWRPWLNYCEDEIPHFDPAWLESPPHKSTRAAASASARRSTPAIRNGSAYISHVRAISGQGGHNATFRAACVLREAGMTADEAFQALVAWNETNCDPKWSDEELAHKVEDAFKAQGH